jgi:site-specific DNA-methyltransferase (adenine-specific)
LGHGSTRFAAVDCASGNLSGRQSTTGILIAVRTFASTMNKNYNPDVLTCLANLSSDEVFTPPQLANEILNHLPPEIWRDKNARFLDPFCKSGVFLREITKRLLVGLEKQIPDQQKRINHILQHQVFGIGIAALQGP